MNIAFLFTGFGGIFLGLLMLFYLISILHDIELGEGHITSLMTVAEAKETVRWVAISFGVYSLSMIAGGIGLLYDSPMIDDVSRFAGGFSLIAFIYFLHRVHSKSVRA